jgi:Subtilase family
MAAVLAALSAALTVAAAPAHAEEQPAILKAYGLDWIERVREEAWPQPKAERPVICLLDTGVDITPDTPADDPNGPIVARLALDGGTGVAQGTEWQHLHGTQMASIIAAPRNDYGTVGVFPQARIVSIRVTDGRDTFIRPDAVVYGVRQCLQYGVAHHVRVSVVSLAESHYAQRDVDRPFWQSAGVIAEAADAAVVAAAGNDEGPSLQAPLGIESVVAVAAGDESGTACSFVADLAQPGAIRGPGCALSRSWPAGSSAATAAVSALLAAYVTHSPGLTVADARKMLTGALRRDAAGVGVLDASAVAAGFPVDPAPIRVPETPSLAVSSTASPSLPTRLWRPRVRAGWRGSTLTVRRLDRRAAGRLVVELGQAGSQRRLRARGVGRKARFKLDKAPRSVRVWIEGSSGGWQSLTVRCRVL